MWTIHGDTFHRQVGLFADKLFEVTTETLASLREQRSLSRGEN